MRIAHGIATATASTMSSTQIPTKAALLSELHSATRSEHAQLNRAITARLPLCLPPHAPNSYSYAAGMTAYAQIYFAMEKAWDALLEENSRDTISARHRDILMTLRTPYLKRTQRLELDLQNLHHSLGSSAVASLEQMQAQSHHINQDIQDTLRAKPHLLIAYAWPMYLALFNGGRWIASQLLSAGPTFWLADEDSISRDFLSFWYFDESVRDEHHGDNVKDDLKHRLNAASELLTETETDEVLLEVKRVFAICSTLIDLLDQHAAQVQANQHEAVQLSGDASGIFGWVASVIPGRSVWQNFKSLAGFAAAYSP